MHIIEISFWRDKICCYLHYGKEAHPLPVFWNLKRQFIVDAAFNSIDLLIIRTQTYLQMLNRQFCIYQQFDFVRLMVESESKTFSCCSVIY